MAYCGKTGFFLVGVYPLGPNLLCLESLKFAASWAKESFVDERDTKYGAFCLPICTEAVDYMHPFFLNQQARLKAADDLG
jgi:hypothetical protein